MTSLKDPPQEQGDTSPDLDGSTEPSAVACANPDEPAETAAQIAMEVIEADPVDALPVELASPPLLPAEPVLDIPAPVTNLPEIAIEVAETAELIAEAQPLPEPEQPEPEPVQEPEPLPVPDEPEMALPEARERSEPVPAPVADLKGSDLLAATPEPIEETPSAGSSDQGDLAPAETERALPLDHSDPQTGEIALETEVAQMEADLLREPEPTATDDVLPQAPQYSAPADDASTTGNADAVEPQLAALAAPAIPLPVVPELPRVIPTDLSLSPSPSTIAPPRFHAPPAAPAVSWDRLPPQEYLPPEPPRAPPPKSIAAAPSSPWRARARRLAVMLLWIGAGYAALVLLLIGVYRFVDPPRSTVMLGVHLSGEPVDYRPVSIGNISSYLQRAVVTSEDARFCRHWGVDWGALLEAMQDARGGSTITMQTAKNLFLWPSRSYIRKAIEIPVAMAIDLAWPKRRILEVYLNIAEWGPGIFGAEAAAWYHFDKPASRLTPQEATLLAASLPNPIAREAGDPGRVTALLAARLRGRMANSDAYVGCLGLRQMPRLQQSEPAAQKSVPKPAPKPSQWQTKTEPAKPEAPQPFNPWQN